MTDVTSSVQGSAPSRLARSAAVNLIGYGSERGKSSSRRLAECQWEQIVLYRELRGDKHDYRFV